MSPSIDKDSVRETVVRLLSDTLGIDGEEISEDKRLGDDLGLDSVGTIELLYELEVAFDVHIPDDSLAEIETVRDLVRCVLSQIG